MNIKAINDKLAAQCPSAYRINEIIPIAYPYRQVKVSATVNKSPEESINQIYISFIRSINAGYTSTEQLAHFLGLQEDDFLLRELYVLREKGFLNLVSDKWLVTPLGNEYIKDNSILKVLEKEDFIFLMDAIADEVLPYSKGIRLDAADKFENRLKPEIYYPIKSPDLLNHKHDQIADVYNAQHGGNSLLVDFDKEKIKFDSGNQKVQAYYLIEYTPLLSGENESPPYIEIRNKDKDYSLDKRLTKILTERYPSILYEFSKSERSSFAQLEDDEDLLENEFKPSVIPKEMQTLSIWETQERFKEAIQTAKKKLLIESPWIKRATLTYIPLLEKALKRGVAIIVLYGIEQDDNHFHKAIKEMERLEQTYPNCYLIHLPTHFEYIRNDNLTGTHKKLVIKDNDYCLQGSFNFLSFNKQKGQKVANEESFLVPHRIQEKWKKVFDAYELHDKININLF